MSIHAISGKPGGGKTMYSCKMILDELLYGTRVIVTNVPLSLGAVNEYIQRVYPRADVDVTYRIRFLDDDTTGKFWTFRPEGPGHYGWVRIPQLTKEEWAAGKKPLYSGIVDEGVMYVIDECHNFFNARAWAETGRDVLFYLSQHRKLGDTVVWVTQAVGNVDKQFRSVTQDYTYVRNLTKEKAGLFRLPAMFVRKTYGEPATPNSQAMETGTFKLNVTGLASLYNTAAGVGIHDRKSADKSERKKGLHWLWPVILVPLFLVLVAKFVPHFIGEWFNPMKNLHPSDSVAPASVAAVASRRRGLDESPAGKLGVTNPPALSTNQVPDMVAYVVRPIISFDRVVSGKSITVELSNGVRYHNGDGHLQFLCPEYCIVDGQTNLYRAVVKVAEAPLSVYSGSSGGSLPLPLAASETYNAGSGSGSSVYVIPHHVNAMAHPAIRSAISGSVGGGYSQGY